MMGSLRSIVGSGYGAVLAALLPLAAWSQSTPPSQEAQRWQPAIARGRAAIQHAIDARQAPGVGVAVAVGGTLVWSEGFGSADVAGRAPVTRATRFGLGSVSKSLTMAAALVLVDRGLLDLDRPVEAYLPDFPHQGQGITVRKLAAHQSGLADSFAMRSYFNTAPWPVLDSAYQRVRNERLVYPPGSDTLYGTGLYTIIGRVMERAAGRPFRALMREALLDPLKLASVVPNDPVHLPPNRAVFYVDSAGQLRPGPPLDPGYKLPGAGYVGTAEDVARFGAALLQPGFLSDSARRELFRPVALSSGAPTGIALGFRVADDGGRRVFHQPGGGVGISAWLFLFPDDELVIALLSNLATAPVGGRMYREIRDGFLDAITSPGRQ